MTMPNSKQADDAAGHADPNPAFRLAQEIVIENAGGDAQVGAQAIAPDHSPRAAVAPSGLAPAVRTAPLPMPVPGVDVLREIEQFLYRQSELLDGKLWQDYIDLFA